MPPAFRPASWGREIVLRITVASGIGYLATAYSVSRWLTRRSPGRPLPPVLPNVHCESSECRTTEQLRLRGWAFTPREPCGTVALFHGLQVNRSQTLDRIAF